MNNNKIVAYSMSALMLAVLGKMWLSSADEPVIGKASNSHESPLVQAEKVHEPVSGFQKARAGSSSDQLDEVWISEGVKQQMVDVAEAYKENMRYPSYSTPLHTNNWAMMNPRAFVPKLVELDLEGLSAQIEVDQYIVSRDKNLPVKVIVHGASNGNVQIGEVRIFLGREVSSVVAEKVPSHGEEALTYSATIPASNFAAFEDSELALNAAIILDSGDKAQASTAIKLAGTDAVLTGLGSSYVDDSDLSIPAYFEVSNPGFYRIRANLFDAESGAPISHINASFMLSETENEGLLKVHASTLRSKGFAGPYLLKDFDITRGPARPGDKTGYGTSETEEFSVQGFDLNSYSREPYHDPKNQQRLEFLQKMAGIQ